MRSSCSRYDAAAPATKVDLPAPGGPVNPHSARARPNSQDAVQEVLETVALVFNDRDRTSQRRHFPAEESLEH